ncbi:MAG: efflux transporter periplasmic adaptor subunit [Niastella sp. SCN 39-18]|nr:efflux RND transporter periplasmic adaptor subunit [Sphingobacteriales bacterium]ODT51912.1 MAG: efflux transporter periplasmic adaptor subunit [Niastella sp. SCN 39-18]OJW11542.1 MAG: efflux transporter periplasmic adaptor subunit [Sphingobacteriales bacterium 39-19]
MKHIFILLLVLSVSCGRKTEEVNTNTLPNDPNVVTLTDAQIKNAEISIGKLEQKDMSSIIKVNGKIDVPPQNMVSISVPLGGYLKSTRLLPGMHVSKGEVIAIIEDQQYIQLQQDYLTAKARLSYLKNEYERQKLLSTNQAGSDKVYQLAHADYKAHLVLLTSLTEKLKLAGININKLSENHILRSVNIYSPINGFVTKVNVNIGKYVSPTEVLFELVNPDDIHLALTVYERDLNKLNIGQNLIAFTNNMPGKKYACKIILIGKNISNEGSAEVHCHFEQYDKILIPGTYMNAEIAVQQNNAYVLPDDAVVRYDSKHYVYMKKSKNQFEMKEVMTGENKNGYTEIILPRGSNLLQADMVIKGAYSLLMMMKNKDEE